MFGKMMNNFYYGKSGKGDFRKEDLPKNRFQLFWAMLRVRLSSLFRLNLMTLVAWLPLILVIVSLVSAALENTNNSFIYKQYYETGVIMEPLTQEQITRAETELQKFKEENPEYKDYDNITLIEYTSTQNTLGRFRRALILLIPCILITGPIQAGMAYVTRNWSRDEHAFIWSDFKDAVKENWKQGLGVSFISSLVPILMYTCYTFYGDMAGEKGLFFMVPQMLVLTLGAVWYLSCTFMYPLMVSYKLKFKALVKNGMMLAIARLPHTIVIRLAALLPTLVLLALAFLVSGNIFLYALLALMFYYMLLGFSMSRFIFASFTNGVFDKYINSRIKGVQVNRGLSDEEDEDDEEEEDSPSDPGLNA